MLFNKLIIHLVWIYTKSFVLFWNLQWRSRKKENRYETRRFQHGKLWCLLFLFPFCSIVKNSSKLLPNRFLLRVLFIGENTKHIITEHIETKHIKINNMSKTKHVKIQNMSKYKTYKKINSKFKKYQLNTIYRKLKKIVKLI